MKWHARSYFLKIQRLGWDRLPKLYPGHVLYAVSARGFGLHELSYYYPQEAMTCYVVEDVNCCEIGIGKRRALLTDVLNRVVTRSDMIGCIGDKV